MASEACEVADGQTKFHSSSQEEQKGHKKVKRDIKRSVTEPILELDAFTTCLDKIKYCPDEFDEEQFSTGLTDDGFIPKGSPRGLEGLSTVFRSRQDVCRSWAVILMLFLAFTSNSQQCY